jgi:glutamyl-tRNA reductase
MTSQIFEDVASLNVLFVGAGEMVELVATHFASRRPRSITIANRTPERARELVSRFGAQAMPLAEVPARLHQFDVVVSSTASTLPIIGLGAVERAVRQRRRRPIVMFDLAVPRDIEAEVSRLADVFLYTIDDLGAMARQGFAGREAALTQAEAIVEVGGRGFEQWLAQRDAVPIIRALQSQAEQWQQAELRRARRALSRGTPVEDVLAAFSRGLAGKMMHGALAALHSPDADRRGEALPVVQRLFLDGSRRGQRVNRLS